MPDDLRGQYQYFTEAPHGPAARGGLRRPFTPLEDGVRRYVQDFWRDGSLSLMLLAVLLFPASTRSWSRSGPSRSAGTRWPISPASCSAGGWLRRLVRAAAGGRDARSRWTTSSPGRRSASSSAAGSATCSSTSRPYFLAHPLEILRSGRAACRSMAACSASSSRSCCSAGSSGSPLLGFARPHRRGGADRALPRAHRQLHQRRAVGPRCTDVPWAMVFPTGGPVPRHPSQLYQACWKASCCSRDAGAGRTPAIRARPGFARRRLPGRLRHRALIGEFFRQPDAFLGFLFAGATMGQLCRCR